MDGLTCGLSTITAQEFVVVYVIYFASKYLPNMKEERPHIINLLKAKAAKPDNI